MFVCIKKPYSSCLLSVVIPHTWEKKRSEKKSFKNKNLKEQIKEKND